MENLIKYLPLLVFFISCNEDGGYHHQIRIQGLLDEVEVIRDEAGINHIYASNQHDLFLAQGYCAARDRLFKFEIWRRQATGTVAEILGPRELKRDIGTELSIGRAVAKLSPEKVKEYFWFHPIDPKIALAPSIDGTLLFNDILELYHSFRSPVR
ncbi:MAG: hypothetical protein AMS26_05645, partial [Bacteroides sp. SM23_62]